MAAVSAYVRGRRGLSRQVIDFDPAEDQALVAPPAGAMVAAAPAAAGPALRGVAGALAPLWPPGLAPTAVPEPDPDPTVPLPQADYVVITWTAAELRALANVLTPGVNATTKWHKYTHNYDTLLPNIRNGAPALNAKRLASWYRTTIGTKSILCIKSELHLNQDSKATGDGTATLPIADLFRQIIAEVQPKLIITTGTAGGTLDTTELGDVVITRAARFRLADEFRNEAFNNQLYKSKGTIKKGQLATAAGMLSVSRPRLHEPDFGPPTTRYPSALFCPVSRTSPA